MSSDKFSLRRDTSLEEMSWALIDFARGVLGRKET